MIRYLVKSEQGQTAVEYILILVCAVSFGLLFVKKMDQYLVKNPKGIIGAPLNKFSNALNQDPTGRYRTFPLPISSRSPSGKSN